MTINLNMAYLFLKLAALISFFRLDDAYGLRLLNVSVPPLADPRKNLTISCSFDMGGEDLNSVKWYKDEQEFFRYTPTENPPIRTFPVAGVHLAVENSECRRDRCTSTLTDLTREHSGGAYKCEISSEAPAFRVVFNTTNVTVVALPKSPPQIKGVSASYSVGDLVIANCSAPPADPPPLLTWFLNNKEVTSSSNMLGPSLLSSQDPDGLMSASLSLRFLAERVHFVGSESAMEVRCIASWPSISQAVPQEASIKAVLRSPSLLNNQQLKWPNSSGSNIRVHGNGYKLGVVVGMVVVLCQILLHQ